LFLKQQLGLEQLELQPHRPEVLALQEAEILVGAQVGARLISLGDPLLILPAQHASSLG